MFRVMQCCQLKRWLSNLLSVAAIAVAFCQAVYAVEPDEPLESEPVAAQSGEQSASGLFNNPGSIVEQQNEDLKKQDYLFQVPGGDALFGPISDKRGQLRDNYGLIPGGSITHIYQSANETVGMEDDAEAYEININGVWTLAGRDSGSPAQTRLGFEAFYVNATSDVPPVALFTQVGSLYPTAVAFVDVDPSIGQLFIQHRFPNRVGFQVGKVFPITAYDFFPLKNFRTDFVDAIHAANIGMPLPNRGIGGFMMYKPVHNIYLRAGIHDANADPEDVGLTSFFDDQEYFSIFEVGFDPGIAPRMPGRPPSGDIHLSLWHQEEREDINMDDGWGLILSASQRFGRYLPFLRYGYTDADVGGPSAIEHMVNAGFAMDNIFGQSRDRLGIGATWTRPINDNLDDQGALDVFYRIQVTPQIAVSPMLQLIFDPVRNTQEDQVWVWSVRTRLFF